MLPAVRRLAWMTLQAAGVLSLTGCFTIIDFDLGGGGGAGSGGDPTTGTATTAGGSPPLGGSGGTGGQSCDANLESDEHNCGSCGHDCEGGECLASVCQAAELFVTGETLGVMGVGGGSLAVVNGANQVCSIDLEAGPPFELACQRSPDTKAWGSIAFGTSVAVDADGAAYYSPQSADSTSPIYRCDGDPENVACFPVPQPLVGNAEQLNGLLIHGDSLVGVNPTGSVWQVPLDGISPPTREFTAVGGSDESYALAVGGGSLLVGQLGALTDPCVVVGEESYLDHDAGDATAPCSFQLSDVDGMSGEIRLSALAAGPKDVLAVRFNGDFNGLSGRTLTAVQRAGKSAADAKLFADLAVEGPSTSLVGDETAIYFFGEAPGLTTRHLYRCGYDGELSSCVAVSGNVAVDGAIAIDAKYVYFTAGDTIFRAVR
jgi:hypothetical protein